LLLTGTVATVICRRLAREGGADLGPVRFSLVGGADAAPARHRRRWPTTHRDL